MEKKYFFHITNINILCQLSAANVKTELSKESLTVENLALEWLSAKKFSWTEN